MNAPNRRGERLAMRPGGKLSNPSHDAGVDAGQSDVTQVETLQELREQPREAGAASGRCLLHSVADRRYPARAGSSVALSTTDSLARGGCGDAGTGDRRQRGDRLLRRRAAGFGGRGGGDRQPRPGQGAGRDRVDPLAGCRREGRARPAGPGGPRVAQTGRGSAGGRPVQRRCRARRAAAAGNPGRARADVRHQPPRPLRAGRAADAGVGPGRADRHHGQLRGEVVSPRLSRSPE